MNGARGRVKKMKKKGRAAENRIGLTRAAENATKVYLDSKSDKITDPQKSTLGFNIHADKATRLKENQVIQNNGIENS
jgi:hypothetical protein